MERADLLSLAAGLVIVIVIALFIKPMIAAAPINQTLQGSDPAQVTFTPTPTPLMPGWDGKVRDIGFVDPATYHLNISDEQVRWRETPSGDAGKDTMVPYATIRGTGSGTTEIIHVPVPYWELRYDADPYNTEFGYLNVQVMDAADPNRFVRIVTLQRADLVPAENATREWKNENWKETFYEGQRDYWFVINTRCIRSYTLQVMVPEKYVPGNLQ
ncbi:MAG: hypothetical protein PHP59_12025 [Methanofollis sp.]|uniref:hypothetical protein n=1 Tax=Methanofollis sp. TaxID=2052835 RepID=UPI002621D975|nr:hypothetical protein [Methanofollis sp.]MDD4256086.1 hypothetical protein [Methanofollis sp.]